MSYRSFRFFIKGEIDPSIEFSKSICLALDFPSRAVEAVRLNSIRGFVSFKTDLSREKYFSALELFEQICTFNLCEGSILNTWAILSFKRESFRSGICECEQSVWQPCGDPRGDLAAAVGRRIGTGVELEGSDCLRCSGEGIGTGDGFSAGDFADVGRFVGADQ